MSTADNTTQGNLIRLGLVMIDPFVVVGRPDPLRLRREELGSIVATRLAPKSVKAFFDDDRHHH